jgi:FkbM family methyltransferase
MKKLIITFFLNAGIFFGKILKFSPNWFKKFIVIICGKIIVILPNKISFLFFSFIYEVVKHMYWKFNGQVFLLREYFHLFKMKLDIVKKTQRVIYLQKLYQPNVSNYLLKNLKKGGVFIDVGAHVGFYSLLSSKLLGENGRVFSFEAENTNFHFLQENVILNKLKNIKIVNKAVGSNNDVAELFINPLNEGGNSLVNDDYYYDNDEKWRVEKIIKIFPNKILKQNVEMVSIDHFLHNNNLDNLNIDMIKVDVEGAEYDVLLGARNLLFKFSPAIICEVSKNQDKINDLLEELNYKVYCIDKNGDISIANNLIGRDFLFLKK